MSNVLGAICGESMDIWLGVPTPTRPRCAAGHRARFMRPRYSRQNADTVYLRDYKCRCGNVITWAENLELPHNGWWQARMARLDARMHAFAVSRMVGC